MEKKITGPNKHQTGGKDKKEHNIKHPNSPFKERNTDKGIRETPEEEADLEQERKETLTERD